MMYYTVFKLSLFFGSFPYKFDEKKKLHFSHIGAAWTIINIVCNVWRQYVVYNDIKTGFSQFNLQTFLLLLVHTAFWLIMLIRLYRWKPVKETIHQIMNLYNEEDPYICARSYIMKTLAMSKYLLLIFLLYGSAGVFVRMGADMRVLLRRLFWLTFPATSALITPLTIESQYIMFCIVLNSEFRTVNRSLSLLLEKVEHVNVKFSKYQLDTLICVRVREHMRRYSELLATVKCIKREHEFIICILATCLIFFGIYNINGLLLLQYNKGYKKYPGFVVHFKIFYDLYILYTVLFRIIWISYESDQMLNEMKNGQTVILSHCYSNCPSSICIEIEKYLLLLNRPEHESDLCGFLILKKKFLFQSLGILLLFAILFVELKK